MQKRKQVDKHAAMWKIYGMIQENPDLWIMFRSQTKHTFYCLDF